MSTVEIKVKKHVPFAEVPQYQTVGSSGMDVRSVQHEEIMPGDRCLISTGLSFQIPRGYEIQVRPRSGLALKHGITVLNTPGTIDSDYTGIVGVILMNNGNRPFEIHEGDRIAQLVVCPVVQANLSVVEDLEDTDRGSGGFGSTGVNK